MVSVPIAFQISELYGHEIGKGSAVQDFAYIVKNMLGLSVAKEGVFLGLLVLLNEVHDAIINDHNYLLHLLVGVNMHGI